jgi:hypothetical protein
MDANLARVSLNQDAEGKKTGNQIWTLPAGLLGKFFLLFGQGAIRSRTSSLKPFRS